MAGGVSFKFDMSEMNESLRRLTVVSDKLPSELVNQKSWRIFQKATWWMKAVEKETIQQELGASAALELVKLKSGRFSRSKKNIRQFFGQGNGTGDFPLLAAIIQSRAGKGGKPSPWKGVDRATGANRMLDEMRKVYGARQKSRGYFKACFATLRDVFKQASGKLPFSSASSRGSGTVASLARDRGRIADGNPAAKNSSVATASFWIVSPKHDIKNALDKHAALILQRAIDEEASSTAQHAAEKEYRGAIAALGIKVT